MLWWSAARVGLGTRIHVPFLINDSYSLFLASNCLSLRWDKSASFTDVADVGSMFISSNSSRSHSSVDSQLILFFTGPQNRSTSASGASNWDHGWRYWWSGDYLESILVGCCNIGLSEPLTVFCFKLMTKANLPVTPRSSVRQSQSLRPLGWLGFSSFTEFHFADVHLKKNFYHCINNKIYTLVLVRISLTRTITGVV